MTARVGDGPTDPAALVRGTEDPASGALVVVTAARGGSDPAADGQGEQPPGAGAPPTGADAGTAVLGRALASIEDEALERFDVRRCRLGVRAGSVPDGPEVLAVVRAAHRGAAFDAARWAVASALGRLTGGGAAPGDGAGRGEGRGGP